MVNQPVTAPVDVEVPEKFMQTHTFTSSSDLTFCNYCPFDFKSTPNAQLNASRANPVWSFAI